MMYNPECFEQNDIDQLKKFIADYPLAILVCSSSMLEGNHIPLYWFEGDNNNFSLRGHIAVANSLWREVDEASEVLIIFQGPQGYISPNWYETKKEHGKAVPTWNYTAIYINGTISFIKEKQWKLEMLEILTNNSERKGSSPWKVSDAPVDFINKQLNAIVGIEISIKTLQGKWKLSQNQPEKNREGILKGLSDSDDCNSDDLLKFMQKIENV